MGRVVVLTPDPPIVDGWYIVTANNLGYQWRGAGEYNQPFPTQYAAERAAELDGIDRPYWVREAIASVLTVSE